MLVTKGNGCSEPLHRLFRHKRKMHFHPKESDAVVSYMLFPTGPKTPSLAVAPLADLWTGQTPLPVYLSFAQNVVANLLGNTSLRPAL